MPIGDPSPTTGGPLGWQCPVCHAVYAPWMATCTECKPAARSPRERIAETEPAAPYAPSPVYPAPLFPAPQWPYGQVVWCDAVPAADYTLALTPEARARMTACSGAGMPLSSFTVNLGAADPRTDGDDGTAGVPARV